MGKHKKRGSDSEDETPSSASSSSSYSSDESDSYSKKSRRKRRERRRSDEDYKREKRRKREREEKRRKLRERKRRKSKKRKSKKRDYDSDSDSGSKSRSGSGSESDSGSDRESLRDDPQAVVKELLKEFPNVGNDLRQLLQMIDDGQAVDIKGISESALKNRLKKLFSSLKLKECGDRVFLLPSGASPTLDEVGHLIKGVEEEGEHNDDNAAMSKEADPADAANDQTKGLAGESELGSNPSDDVPGPKRRVIGPAMPSAELLAAAAKLTEAQAELREAELEEDSELFVGPAPPAVVAEVASSNEAERFEEVTRIMEAEAESPYDILGVNHNMSAENIKKRYWKLSLLVHPDKCSHPQAQQAFVLLNKAFKELQDPEKRKAMDEKIKLKEEQEAFKAELKSMREAAQWRRSQGISMEGDEELLAATEVKPVPKRDEWMTTLPPERKPGVAMHSTTTFSRNAREGRGDTSAWTDTPLDRAQKAKTNYLEAYNEATALASNEEHKSQRSLDAELVDKYNKEKRSKSLVEKYKEGTSSRLKKNKKKKSTSKDGTEKEEWVGKHPWKPWDRENDLTAGRKAVKLDSDGMAEGLASRFSSGNFQRSFL
ncbi:PREDICTED: transcriptional regulator ATRX homolog [Tarenaya hassleriana]|uniref:transcriptional regulator ATRX homolog n=1 Tax=Tarenaya hassleriana TaxID=28532 RepID=UPI00053C7182|nr:PREDICTED: transcriptional regulator ATRX homolog [Tarenaya hassleriana]